MNIDITLCRNCSKEIPFGTAYYSICKNLESLGRNEKTEETEIEVEDSIEVTKLCEPCGKLLCEENISVILENLPIRGQEINN